MCLRVCARVCTSVCVSMRAIVCIFMQCIHRVCMLACACACVCTSGVVKSSYLLQHTATNYNVPHMCECAKVRLCVKVYVCVRASICGLVPGNMHVCTRTRAHVRVRVCLYFRV